MINSQHWLSAASGQQIYTESWQPDGPMKAALIIAHGLSEHCHRYLPLIEHFVGLGYGVFALDHEGHGRSEGQRGYIRRFSDYVDTLAAYIDTISQDYPQLPRFLIGHSMGGVIATNYLIAHQTKIAGCILSGAALDTSAVISPVQKKLLQLLSFISPKAGLIKLEGEAVSRDPAVVHAYETDPLVFRGKASARLLAEIIHGAETGLGRASTVTLPLLLLHGSADRLANPQGSIQFHTKASSADKQLRIYDGLYHEIFLEPERGDVFADIATWLEERQPC